MARKIPTFLTRGDVLGLCLSTSSEELKENALDRSLLPKPVITLLRKTFTLYFDNGRQCELTFLKDSVLWKEGGAQKTEAAEYYEGPTMGIHFVHFLRTDVSPFLGITLVLDLPRASFTAVEMKLGNRNSNRDVERTVLFGRLDRPGTSAHGSTEELTGKVIDWKFAEDVKIHLMFENQSCSEIVSRLPAKTPEWASYYETFNPTKYVKLRNSVYLITFYAPGDSGAAFNLLFDTRRYRALGAFFGIDLDDRLRFYTFGGVGAPAPAGHTGKFTVE